MYMTLVPGPRSIYTKEAELKKAWAGNGEWEILNPGSFKGEIVTRADLEGAGVGTIQVTVMYGRDLEYRARFIVHQKREPFRRPKSQKVARTYPHR
jgi:hypothetical protein